MVTVQPKIDESLAQLKELNANLEEVESLLDADPTNEAIRALQKQLSEAIALLSGDDVTAPKGFLPPEWLPLEDEGGTYYYNSLTGSRQRERP